MSRQAPLSNAPNRRSFSQVDLFQRCPHAYWMKYYGGYTEATPPYVEFGKLVHAHIETDFLDDPQTRPFVQAVIGLRHKLGVVTQEREQKFSLDIDGTEWTGFIDEVVSGGEVWDFKVTSNPSSYRGKLGYQLPLYRLAKPGHTSAYVLLKRGRGQGPSYGYEDIEYYRPDFSSDIYSLSRKFLSYWAKAIDNAENTQTFPPIFSGCASCSMRGACCYTT